jgi:hypothetical protein
LPRGEQESPIKLVFLKLTRCLRSKRSEVRILSGVPSLPRKTNNLDIRSIVRTAIRAAFESVNSVEFAKQLPRLALLLLLALPVPAATIYGYEVDVTPPNVVTDGIAITDYAGVGRPIDSLTPWVACLEDIRGGGDRDYNDLCVRAEVGFPLLMLGGLAAFHNTASWLPSGQVQVVSPQGTWATGSSQVWAGRVIQPIPEPSLLWLGLVALGGIAWRKRS